LVIVSFLGMLNGMGRDRGAALVLEQAILPQTSDDQSRTRIFAWYNVLQDSGHAIGGVVVGFPLLIGFVSSADPTAQYKYLLFFCAILMLATAILYTRLSSQIVAPPKSKPPPVTTETKKVVGKLSGLFLLDALGGGFLTTALISFFFFERFGISVKEVGLLFFAARVLNALSHLGAAWLSSKIGLVNTMVFTHIPSSLFLASVGFAPNFTVAAILFLLREGLVEMDVPTRQSYVMAVVKPEERTFASGATSLVRLGGWAIAPSFAGLFMEGVSMATALIAGAGLKILYDILLYRSFRGLKPPEETAR
jgi:MFS family permease